MAMPGQRLYLRIWLAVVAAVALLTLIVGWLAQEAFEQDRAEREARVTRTLVIRDASGAVVGEAPSRAHRSPDGWEFAVRMHDGQELTVALPRPGRPPGAPPGPPPGRMAGWLLTPAGFAWLIGLVAIAVALGAYPIVRRLTQRLEALQRGVERWGAGDLSVRLPVQGRDEVAFLANRFNAAAERVEALLASHKALLANASHELRSPLARIRLGVELLGHEGPTPAQRAEIARNLAELDQLIDEILLASRLDHAPTDDPGALGPLEPVDLVGLAAEECARTGADLVVDGEPLALEVTGEGRLLRRVLRNLLENARRHGRGGTQPGDAAAVVCTLARRADAVTVTVDDRGPGVPVGQRERVFEPFYRLPGASERDGGVGLGLALVRGIVTRHGGTVHVTDRPGGGARFEVRLPAGPAVGR